MKADEIIETQNNKIKQLIEESVFNNPLIIKTKYGFTKIWKDEEIHYSSWGKNWTDKTPTSADIDFVIKMIAKSKNCSFNK
jgi:hypothetical protein